MRNFPRNPFDASPAPEEMITDPVRETPDVVSYLGVTLEKAKNRESAFVPRRENYADYINDAFALELQKKIAVALLQGEPVLIEGGTSIGKTTTVKKMAAELGYEVHYANLNGATDVEDLMGRYIPNPRRSKPSDPEYIFADGKVTSGLRQEKGKKKIIILDELNAAAPNILIRLHEVLDALERGGDVTLSEDASESVPVSHENTKVVALMNPPGKGYVGREPLDPAQLRRWVYHKEATNLPARTFSMATDALFELGPMSEAVSAKAALISREASLSTEQLKEIPGLSKILGKYKEFHRASKALLGERTIAADQPQAFMFDDRMEPRRIRDFVMRFYRGDINATFQEALRYYYANKLESVDDRAKLELLIEHVAYVPEQVSKRKGLEVARGVESALSSEQVSAVLERNHAWQKEFFGKTFEMPPLPLAVTPERLRHWESLKYELRFLPPVTLNEKDSYPGWMKKPGKRYTPGKQYGIDYFDELQNIQNLPENKNNSHLEGLAPNALTGQWTLMDTRPKPGYEQGKQSYENDQVMQELLRRLTFLNDEARTGLRNGIHPSMFDKPELWEEIKKMLWLEGVSDATARLPRVIEQNVLGQGPAWSGTNTWEWSEEYHGSGNRLRCGYSGLDGASSVYWFDAPSDNVGFRPLVVFSSDIENLEPGSLELWERKLREKPAQEAKILSVFFEKKIDVPPVPAEITPARLEQWEKLGLELHYIPAEDMEKSRKLKGWKKPPNDWFYDQIANGKIPKDATKLQAGWFVVDARQKPSYENGDQMYADDPLAETLEGLNRKGVVSQQNYNGTKKFSAGSRFGLHPNDFENPKLAKAFAEALDLKDAELTLPRLIEWNAIANIHHPEWGKTDVLEWVQEKSGSGYRLLCGNSGNDGASHVYWLGEPHANVGFRPLGRFS